MRKENDVFTFYFLSQINHLGSIDVDISGLGPLDWILELLVDFVDTFFRVSVGDSSSWAVRDLCLFRTGSRTWWRAPSGISSRIC